MKPATKIEARRPAKPRRPTDLGKIKSSEMVILSNNATAAQKRAAAARLLKGMPCTVKPGEKPAHILLAEYRAGW